MKNTQKMLGDTSKWFADKGDETLRLDYNLDKESVVFDVGGYMGWFTEHIHKMYESFVYCFEPICKYSELLLIKFATCPNILILPVAISDRVGEGKMYIRDDSSSLYIKYGKPTLVIQTTLDLVLKTYDIDKIDLLKLNIEGGEYDLLDDMISKDLICLCTDIQVQFHCDIKDYEARYKKISSGLGKTHKLTWRYPFVWESWRLK